MSGLLVLGKSLIGAGGATKRFTIGILARFVNLIINKAEVTCRRYNMISLKMHSRFPDNLV